MSTAITASANTELDTILEEICTALQISQTQYKQAVEHYEAVGNWISEDPVLAKLAPRIFPQGSMRLQTTVRPWLYIEYDLDLVYLIGSGTQTRPGDLYRQIQHRLNLNKTYRDRLECHPRCLRLTYAGDFHLDIVPACPDIEYGGSFVRIPSENLEGKRTNPEGYAIWFETQCAIQGEIKAERELTPIPPHQPLQNRSVLRRATQLFKRRRDVFYSDQEDSPASIVLTTLAAGFFQGSDNTTDELISILSRTNALLARSNELTVPNPSNPGEDLTEHWSLSQKHRFQSFISDFKEKMYALMESRGPQLSEALQALFGEAIATQAITSYGKRLEAERRADRLYVTTSTGLLTTENGRDKDKIRRNENFGA